MIYSPRNALSWCGTGESRPGAPTASARAPKTGLSSFHPFNQFFMHTNNDSDSEDSLYCAYGRKVYELLSQSDAAR